MRPRIHLVADDLTGALDSAASFAARGATVRVACRPGDLAAALASDAEVVAVAAGTRDGSEAEAIRVSREVAQTLAGRDGLLFKKIDSRLKGHIAAELSALVPDERPVLINPAIPRMGRVCTGGAVTGTGVETAIPVAPRVGRALTIPDTLTQEDLQAQFPEDLAGTVYVGAAGLAEALAERLWPEPAPAPALHLPLPALLAIGSRDPVTTAQLDALSEVEIHPAPNGCCDLPAPAPLVVIRMTQGATSVSGAEAGAAFAETVARAYDLLRPATLFACGGESAAALLARLGIGQLDLLGEILPGVPVARCGTGSGLTLVTKSGGFGPPDTLVDLIGRLAKD